MYAKLESGIKFGFINNRRTRYAIFMLYNNSRYAIVLLYVIYLLCYPFIFYAPYCLKCLNTLVKHSSERIKQ